MNTLINFLKLIGENFVPEIIGTIELYHQWLDAQKHETGAVVDVEGQKRCHQVMGQLEHTQLGTSINRIALLDDVSHHLRFMSLVDEMNAAEKETLTGILQTIGAQDLINVKLKRNMKRIDCAFVLT